MGSTGQIVGGVVGAVVGGLVTRSPQGVMVGYSLGMAVGSFIDPPRGPEQETSQYRKSDVYINTVQHNVPVPVVYGTNRVAGNYLWLGNIRQSGGTTDGGSGGKSGGDKKGGKKGSQEPVTVYADWAIGLSEGEIAGVFDVFLGDHLIGDVEGIAYTVYTGTASQTADPRIQQDLGVLAPAFRHTAYMVLGGDLGTSPYVPTVNAEVNGITNALHQDTWYGSVFYPNNTMFNTLVNGDGSWLGATRMGGEIYRSIDYGQNWVKVADGFYSTHGLLTFSAMSDHPGHPNRVYATANHGFPGVGFWRSDDGGVTWPYQDIPIIGGGGAQDPYGGMLLMPQPDSENVSFCSAALGGAFSVNIYRSGDGGLSWGMSQAFAQACNLAAQADRLDPTHANSGKTRGYGWLSQGTGWAYFNSTGLGFMGINDTLHKTKNGGATFEPYACPWMTKDDAEAANIFGATWAPFSELVGCPPAGWGNIDPEGRFGLFACTDGTVMFTASGGQETELPGIIGSLLPLVIPAWIQVPTGLDTIYNMAVNTVGIVICGGLKDGLGAVAYSLSRGWDWKIHPTAGRGYPMGLEWWNMVGGAWFTMEHICFATGHHKDYPTAMNGWAGGSVTCLDPIFPSSCGNPALVTYDLLTNKRYGLGLNSYQVDFSSIKSCSLYCTEQVPTGLTSRAGNPQPLLEQRFCLDYIMDTQRPILDHFREMLSSFRGYLCWSQGKVKLKIDRPETTAQSFGMNEIIIDSFSWRKQSRRERPNIVRVEYVEPGHRTIDATGQTGDTGTFISYIEGQAAHLNVAANYKTYRQEFTEASDVWDIETTGERREKVLNLTGIKRVTQAHRMAQFYLNKAVYCANACTFRVGINALRAEVGDVVAITHEIPKWAGKLFRIVEIAESEDDTLALGCLEYNEAIYRDALGVQPHGQEAIAGTLPPQIMTTPDHVGRLTAYERMQEGKVELTYTRLSTSDTFGGAYIYRRIGATGAWERVGMQISNAPTAFVASHLHTVTLVQSLEG